MKHIFTILVTFSVVAPAFEGPKSVRGYLETGGTCRVTSSRQFVLGDLPNMTVQIYFCKNRDYNAKFSLVCTSELASDPIKCVEAPSAFNPIRIEDFSTEVHSKDKCSFIKNNARKIITSTGEEVPYCFGTMTCDAGVNQQAEVCTPIEAIKDSSGKIVKLKCRGASDCLKNRLPSPDQSNFIASKNRMLSTPKTDGHQDRKPDSL